MVVLYFVLLCFVVLCCVGSPSSCFSFPTSDDPSGDSVACWFISAKCIDVEDRHLQIVLIYSNLIETTVVYTPSIGV